MTTEARLYPYTGTKDCPKCGAYCVACPRFHARGSRWILWVTGILSWLYRCPGYGVDHLHYHCMVCGARFAVACRDLKETV